MEDIIDKTNESSNDNENNENKKNKKFIIMGQQDYEKYLEENTKKFVGKGKNGSCYKTTTGDLLKVFNKDVSERKMEPFFEMENDSIMFPRNIISVNNKVKAIEREYVEGKSLNFLCSKGPTVDIEVLKEALDKLSSDIKEISNYKILLRDIVWSNIIWTDKEFKFIDTYYYRKSIFFKGSIESYNLICSFDSILDWIINEKMYYFLVNSSIGNYLRDPIYFHKPSVILSKIQEYLEELLECSINCFDDAEKKLKLVKH